MVFCKMMVWVKKKGMGGEGFFVVKRPKMAYYSSYVRPEKPFSVG